MATENSTAEADTDRFLPIRYPDEAPFWDGLQDHTVVLQKCAACDRFWYPIGPVCPRCLGADFHWRQLAGTGAVSSYVVFHKGWAPWMTERVPYIVVQVEMDEGPRLTANLLGVDPAEVSVGTRVRATFEKVTEEITVLQFEQVTGR